jgi:hypothetical protein
VVFGLGYGKVVLIGGGVVVGTQSKDAQPGLVDVSAFNIFLLFGHGEAIRVRARMVARALLDSARSRAMRQFMAA